jgi:NAD(P)-dependent dehydrogenase (short-subunit alcohol dehydrogenase family)
VARGRPRRLAATEAAVRRVAEERGGIDAVVTCAGIDVPGPLDAVPTDVWERIVAVNLLGTVAVVRAALPVARAGGRQGRDRRLHARHNAVGDATAYCASKFGVVGFTRALTAELKGRVGVTLLTPGGMETHFFDERDERYKPGADAKLADPADVAPPSSSPSPSPRAARSRSCGGRSAGDVLALSRSGRPSSSSSGRSSSATCSSPCPRSGAWRRPSRTTAGCWRRRRGWRPSPSTPAPSHEVADTAELAPLATALHGPTSP